MNFSVSIIVPCYNQAQYLDTTLQSVLEQTYGNWECVIVNDGSTDNSEEIALPWTVKDSRFVYVKQRNCGLSAARNTGLKMVNGTFIQFLDADDYLFPDKLEKQIDSIKKSSENSKNLVCVSSFLHGTYEKGWVTKKSNNLSQFRTSNYLKELVLEWENKLTIPPHAFLFSTNLFSSTNLVFKNDLKNHEDIHCWIRIFNQNPLVIQIDEPLVIYRDSPNSMSKQMRLMGEGYLEALNDLKNNHAFVPEYIDLIKKKINLVCLGYRRFDLMKFQYKIFYAPKILPYYLKRIRVVLSYAHT
jgi:glycosyltransferase involved in cell wall biosynthesis